MRWLVFLLGGLAAALVAAVAAVVVIVLTRGNGIDEEAYRQEVRPLILQWQNNIGLDTFTCGGEEREATLSEQDPEILSGAVKALSDIHRDVQALETPKRYKPGVEAMGAAATELQALNEEFNDLLRAVREIETFDPEAALAGVPPTAENVSWFVRAGGAFETWSTDFQRWSDFVDCTLPGEPERIGELGGYMRQLELDAEQLDRLRQEGPQPMVAAFAPVFDGVAISTRAFTRLTRALEHQVEVERVFADVIAGP